MNFDINICALIRDISFYVYGFVLFVNKIELLLAFSFSAALGSCVIRRGGFQLFRLHVSIFQKIFRRKGCTSGTCTVRRDYDIYYWMSRLCVVDRIVNILPHFQAVGDNSFRCK